MQTFYSTCDWQSLTPLVKWLQLSKNQESEGESTPLTRPDPTAAMGLLPSTTVAVTYVMPCGISIVLKVHWPSLKLTEVQWTRHSKLSLLNMWNAGNVHGENVMSSAQSPVVFQCCVTMTRPCRSAGSNENSPLLQQPAWRVTSERVALRNHIVYLKVCGWDP